MEHPHWRKISQWKQLPVLERSKALYSSHLALLTHSHYTLTQSYFNYCQKSWAPLLLLLVVLCEKTWIKGVSRNYMHWRVTWQTLTSFLMLWTGIGCMLFGRAKQKSLIIYKAGNNLHPEYLVPKLMPRTNIINYNLRGSSTKLILVRSRTNSGENFPTHWGSVIAWPASGH